MGAALAMTVSTNAPLISTTESAAALEAIWVAISLKAFPKITSLSPPPAAASASAIVLATATICADFVAYAIASALVASTSLLNGL